MLSAGKVPVNKGVLEPFISGPWILF